MLRPISLHIRASLCRETPFGSPFNTTRRVPRDVDRAGGLMRKGVEIFRRKADVVRKTRRYRLLSI
jgi:hypothetical protein